MCLSAAKENMISQQLRTNNILDEAILSLFDSVHRENFVASDYQSAAYSDLRLPLAHNQTMLTPLEEATIIQTLDLQGDEKVLQIGTGSGFLTALLAKKASQVISIDCHEALTETAKASLAAAGIVNVTLKTGDGSRGWMQDGPYDVIVIAGGISQLGKHFKPQLFTGGKLFAFVGKPPAMQGRLYHLTSSNEWQASTLFDTDIALLNGIKTKHEFTF